MPERKSVENQMIGIFTAFKSAVVVKKTDIAE
jgi:hypothetical protein